MGHSLTDRSQWIIPNPNRPTNEDAIYSPKYVPNYDQLGRYCSEVEISKILGVDIKLSHIPVKRMIRLARETMAKLHPIKGKGSDKMTKEQQNLLIEVANHLGYAPESIAVSLKTRKQVTLRGVIENGQKIVKCTRQKVTEQQPLSQESQQQRRIGAVLLPAFNDSDQAQNARIVCVFILISS